MLDLLKPWDWLSLPDLLFLLVFLIVCINNTSASSILNSEPRATLASPGVEPFALPLLHQVPVSI